METLPDKVTKPASAVWYLGSRKQTRVAVMRWEQHDEMKRVDKVGELAAAPISLIHPLDLRLDLRNHSPNGFEWGFGGSGPAQLALADALEDDNQALLLCQAFKWQVVTNLSYEGWLLNKHEVQQIAQKLMLDQDTRNRCANTFCSVSIP